MRCENAYPVTEVSHGGSTPVRLDSMEDMDNEREHTKWYVFGKQIFEELLGRSQTRRCLEPGGPNLSDRVNDSPNARTLSN